MTWANRFRMSIGAILVLLIVLALTVALSQRKGETDASSAAMAAEQYPVGTDYAGTVIEQTVRTGDLIQAGEPIATLQSTALLNDLADDASVPDSDVFRVNDDGTLTILSSITGIVGEFAVPQGAFAASGTTITTIDSLDSLYVEAEFLLDPKDFERIEQRAAVEVTLPNDDELAGTVETLEVVTQDGKALATVKVDVDETRFGQHGGLMTPGTPVSATLSLRNDDALAGMVSHLRGFIGDVRQALEL